MPSLLTLSIPANAVPGESGQPLNRFATWMNAQAPVEGAVKPLPLPPLKVGMLDNLVEQAGDVARSDQQLQNLVHKCHDTIGQLFNHDERKITEAEKVQGATPTQFMMLAEWDSSKYRLDKSINSLLCSMQDEAESADTDFRQQLANLNGLKQQVQALDTKFEGDLSVRALDFVVKPRDIVQSEFLTTVLVAVPLASEKEFLATYESCSQMVVPRSGRKLSADKSFVLYGVTVFRKFSQELEQQLRERKFTVREIPKHEDRTESQDASESQLRTTFTSNQQSIEKLAALTFRDLIKIWAHIRIIRVFVESVLRYGLSCELFCCNFVPQSKEKAEQQLLNQFAFLGGNAVERDQKGRVVAESADMTEYAGLVEQDYRPFVLYTAEMP